MLMQILQPMRARLTSAVPLLEQTAQISGGPGKVLPGEGLSQARALLMAYLQLFPAFGTVWVSRSCNSSALPVPGGPAGSRSGSGSAGNSRDHTQAVVQPGGTGSPGLRCHLWWPQALAKHRQGAPQGTQLCKVCV